MQFSSYTFYLIKILVIFKSTFLRGTLCSESLEIHIFFKLRNHSSNSEGNVDVLGIKWYIKEMYFIFCLVQHIFIRFLQCSSTVIGAEIKSEKTTRSLLSWQEK